MTVPPTIQALLAARLDRLDAEERGVIERGSVEGKVFHCGAVASSRHERCARGRPAPAALVRKELVRPDAPSFTGEDAFRFRHLLIRDAAYESLRRRDARRSARAVRRLARETSAGRMAEYEEILGYHLEQAYRYRAELGALGTTGRSRSVGVPDGICMPARSEPTSGRTSWPREGSSSGVSSFSDGRQRLRATVQLAQVLEEDADYLGGRDTAIRAIAMAEALGDRSEALRAALVLTMSRGQVEPAHSIGMSIAEAGAILEEARRLGDPSSPIVHRCCWRG